MFFAFNFVTDDTIFQHSFNQLDWKPQRNNINYKLIESQFPIADKNAINIQAFETKCRKMSATLDSFALLHGNLGFECSTTKK